MDRSRRLADSILASAGDAIVGTDREGIITLWNPGAERIFGYPANEAIGRSLDLIIPERLRAAHWQGWREVVATGRSRYGEGDLLSVPSVRKDGQRISVEFTIVPLKDDRGSLAGMAAVMRDVTKTFEETKALRQQLARATAASGGEPAAPAR
jgi:PAS domain S-box-containing protein